MNNDNFGNQFDMFALQQKGFVTKDPRGYFRIVETDLDTPFWFKNKLFHRWMMEVRLERKLVWPEIVHHRNGLKNDNRINNLGLTTWDEHKYEHTPSRNLYRFYCENCTKEWLKRNNCLNCHAKQRSEDQEIDDLDDDEDGWWDDDDDWDDE